MGKRTAKKAGDIASYPDQQREDYLLLIAAVAASDGSIHPDELALLNSWMDSFHLSESSRQAILSTIHRTSIDVEEVEERLANTKLVYSLILDMMGMAMADGVLMDDEIFLLQTVAEKLEIETTDFRILLEFVHAAHQASMLSNPEPLYEYNIQSAFQLMKKRKVQLFPHTLLCPTSSDFDQQLKKRWDQYSS